MAIHSKQEIARADMNDDFAVSVWQHKKLVAYTPDEARQFAREIAAAADEADRIAAEDFSARDAAHVPGFDFEPVSRIGSTAPTPSDSSSTGGEL